MQNAFSQRLGLIEFVRITVPAQSFGTSQTGQKFTEQQKDVNIPLNNIGIRRVNN